MQGTFSKGRMCLIKIFKSHQILVIGLQKEHFTKITQVCVTDSLNLPKFGDWIGKETHVCNKDS